MSPDFGASFTSPTSSIDPVHFAVGWIGLPFALTPCPAVGAATRASRSKPANVRLMRFIVTVSVAGRVVRARDEHCIAWRPANGALFLSPAPGGKTIATRPSLVV